MPALLAALEAASFEYGNRTVLREVDLRVHAGDRIALVGRNGSGKSTLLRLMAGELAPTGGSRFAAAGRRVAHLPQMVGGGGSRTLADEILERVGVGPAARRMDEAAERLARGALEAAEEHAAALEAWLALGGDDAAKRLPAAAREAGLEAELLGRPASTLSGGQAARAGLAALLVARLDLALIDEPSNHLDAEGQAFLDRILARARFAYVLASHDRALLERAAERVVELDRGAAEEFAGGWEAYRRERARAEASAERAFEEAVAERERLTAMERRIRQQAVAGQARARRSGETDKFIRRLAIQSAQKNTAASGISKRIERLEVPDKPRRPDVSRLLLEAAEPVGGRFLARFDGVVLARGRWRSGPISLTIEPRERILLGGPNGSGKSSLIAALSGELEPAEGTVALARKARVARLGQERSALLGAGSVLAAFRAVTGTGERQARAALAAMGLGPERVGLSAASLSAGERTRAELAAVAELGAACLVLDEPSNHLDLEALETLERALEGWPGALVVASHDRRAREAIRFDRIFDLGRAG